MSRLADQIRAAHDVTTELYEIPEWDVIIELRSMSARQRASFASTIDVGADGTIELGANRVEVMWSMVIQACCFDPENGEAVFEAEDLEWLMEEKNAGVVDALAQACLGVSGMGADSDDDAGKDSSASETAEETSVPNEDSISN